ncbi:TonB-dependent receptor [Sphingosinicella xenopeptidilytica]|uniref:TonB-dependent receptor domain-containing protein n=1 Tax=Sphingosinicella xenopeptidilytica TaxID=364098 RepID=A0ABW3BZH9_SPHXN
MVIGLGLSAPAAAQDYTSGALSGTVVDADGAPVPNANVTLTSADQGFTRSATSNASGAFRFGALPPGSYNVVISSSAGDAGEEGIRVAASATANYTFVVGAATEIVVTSARRNLDFSNTTTGIAVDLQDLVSRVPLGRSLTDAALLAPTATAGDTTFGNLPSFGGASVAENAYFINGLNITNFDTYLGSAPVPFEFFRSVEVKTGGYPAEYGRATGGIINAVTKAGTNDWTAGIHLNWEPNSLRSTTKDTYRDRNGKDTNNNLSAIAEVGGPIIRDRLFAYGLIEFRDIKSGHSSIESGARFVDRDNDPIWGVKLDAYPLDDHHLEFTYFDTSTERRRTTLGFDPATDTVGDELSQTRHRSGGESYVARYTGNLAEWFTISGAYGVSKERFDVLTNNDGNYVRDELTGVVLSDQKLDSVQSPYSTRREFYRFDADLYFSLLGDHHVRFGMDTENTRLSKVSVPTGADGYDANGLAAAPGGVSYYLNVCGADTPQCLAAGLEANDRYVGVGYGSLGGGFKGKNKAYYVQDEWNVTPRLTVNLGVRLDQFANYSNAGVKYIDLDNAWAPRIGASYDVSGDGRIKLYGNYGRYYLPVASNVSAVSFGSPISFTEYWQTDGTFSASSVPTLTTQITGWDGGQACPAPIFGVGGANCNVIATGAIRDPGQVASRNLKASEEDEIIVGASYRFSEQWTFGVAYTRRRLLAVADDIAIDAAVRSYCDAEGITGCDDIWDGYHQYVVANPNRDIEITLSDPINGEATPRTVTLNAEDIGIPSAARKYDAVEFTFERAFDGVWSLRGSYTWSKSRGNVEGFVQSDFSQNGTGLTRDFDQPDLMEGAYGKLPNHRAHQFKIWGAYQVTDALLLGFNASLTSPRHFGCIGNSRGGFDGTNLGYLYGAWSQYCLGRLQPRGTGLDGTGLKSDWVKNIDVSLRYDIKLPLMGKTTLRADVFNLFNFKGVTDVDQIGEYYQNSDALRPEYGLPIAYQRPRYVRLGLDLVF